MPFISNQNHGSSWGEGSKVGLEVVSVSCQSQICRYRKHLHLLPIDAHKRGSRAVCVVRYQDMAGGLDKRPVKTVKTPLLDTCLYYASNPLHSLVQAL